MYPLRLLWSAIFVVALAVACTAAPGSPPPSVAQVNGVPIVASRVDFELGREKVLLAEQGVVLEQGDLERLRGEVIDRLIAAELIYQKARSELSPDSAEVDAYIGKLREELSDDGEFTAALKAEGLTEEELRDEVRRGIIVRDWVAREVEANVAVTDDAVKSYYEAHQADLRLPEAVVVRHILLASPPGDGPSKRLEARQKAAAARSRIEKGEPFAEVARGVSEDKESAPRGGELGVLLRGVAVEEFEQAAFGLPPGELSEVVESPFGFHIIQVTEKRNGSTPPLGEVAGRIREYLLLQARQEKTEKLVADLKKAARIQRE